MRLAQLARKLSVRPSEIVDLLAKEQLFFEDGSNAKLDDDVVRKVLLSLAPNRLSEIMAEQVLEVEPEPESIPQSKTTEQEPIDKPETELVTQISEVTTPEEIIRAPKIELAGLKVLGKIDLPQSRKQEEVTKTEGAEPTRKQERERRPRQQRDEKQWRNPIAVQREKEARENEERKLAALRQEKERKRQHYLTRVKPTKPIKAMRIYDEPLQEEIHVTPETKPRTWFGKFLKWLNTP